MNNQIKRNIILIGFMGSGKTSAGMVLAQGMSYRFYDTDRLIEQKAGDTINHIFSVYGEEYFRELETNLLAELNADLDQTVLSTGGGLVLREKNTRLLKEMGYVVFLKASKQTTVNRLKGDTTRPLLQGDELEQRVEQLLALRTPVYEKAAHKIIATDDRTVDEIADMIRKAYSEQYAQDTI